MTASTPDPARRQTRPERHSAIESAFLEDRFVLFDDRNAEIHELSPAASLVWDRLDGQTSVEEIVADLSEAFGQPLDDEVLATVEAFAASDLLAGGPSGE